MKKVSIIFFALSLVAALGFAQHGPGDRGPGPAEAHGGEGGEIVGADGTIYITSVTVDTTAHTASTKTTAVRPSGATAWTSTLAFGAHLTLSGSNLIAESASRASDGTVTTTLTAISTASGATSWTKTFTGRVELEPFSGGTYAIVYSGSTRSLVGIGNDGSTLFTLAL